MSVLDRATRFGVLDELIGYHLRRASGVFYTDFSHTVGESGMRQLLFGILSIVEANPGINQGNVGRARGVKRANMVSRVNELVDAGLSERLNSVDDRRAFELTLTVAGRRCFEACLTKIRAHEERLLCDLSPAERRTLSDLLLRISLRQQ